MPRLGDGGASLARLGRRCPERRAEPHRSKFTLGALMDPRFAGLLVLFGEARIEHAAEVNVAGMTAGRDDDAFLGLDMHGIAAVHGKDAKDLSRVRLLANDLRHFVPQENLHTLLACALLQPADEAGTIPIATRGNELARDMPLDRYKRTLNGRGRFRADHPVNEFDSVLDQEVVGSQILVGKDADQIAVAVSARTGIKADPVGVDLIGRILDAMPLLYRVAAAEVQPSPAQHAASADIVVLVNRDDRDAVVARGDGGGETRYPRPDDNHVGRIVPLDLGPGFGRGGRAQRDRADPGGAPRQEGSAAHLFRGPAVRTLVLRVLAHD